jgi:hypothetical protein
MLKRIREQEGKVDLETEFAGERWSQLKLVRIPPCAAESGAFMSPNEWVRHFEHPYMNIEKTKTTHGSLKQTALVVPAYSAFAVPFWWMNKDFQQEIEETTPATIPTDEPAPFPSPWVFGRSRQEVLLKLFFDQVRDEQSLIFLYAKEGNPIGDKFPRLIVGVGRVLKVDQLRQYESSKSPSYPIWDRIIRHSIRPDGYEGFLLPYHEYMAPTCNQEEDTRRKALLEEIAVGVTPQMRETFSYGAELANPDAALSELQLCLEAIRKIRRHGISKGPWERREEWLNAMIAEVWKQRGAFPGLGSALEALGLRMGTALAFDLVSAGSIGLDDDPWPVVESILSGEKQPPKPEYTSDIIAIRHTWESISDKQNERQQLLHLLSRFDLTPAQCDRWFNPVKRLQLTGFPISDREIIENPYCISEEDEAEENDFAITVGTIDRGLLPDATILAKHPVPAPSTVSSQLDVRRVRAAFVSILRSAATDGDSLLSISEAISDLQDIDLAHPCNPTIDFLEANKTVLSSKVQLLRLLVDPNAGKTILALQLVELGKREDQLRKILRSRADRELPTLKIEWEELLVEAINAGGGKFDSHNSRHIDASREQVVALSRITARKLTVLVGRAGTGKTSVLGALLLCKPIMNGGVLLLAPTGKARVRLGKAASADAQTLAQFLYSLNRYDVIRQRPLFKGDKYRKEKTVVVDECSMLTMNDLLALLDALDLAHVERIILVGDPNQLPPIGVGRPFADLVGSMEKASESKEPDLLHFSGALSRLTIEVRASAVGPSDTLRLASWFTRDPQPVDADKVLGDLEGGRKFNDLDVVFWKTTDDLRMLILSQFQKNLGMTGPDDVDGFNKALGFSEKLVPFDKPEGVENFQILSPVRAQPHGVKDLNRWVQETFRASELKTGRQGWGITLGDEEIVVRDKVIQVRNQWRSAYNNKAHCSEKLYLANGEVGVVAFRAKKSDGAPMNILNLLFSGRPYYTIGYKPNEFPTGSGPLELAYVLTVHKAQGSEFRRVFVILPQNCRLLSRELVYTALTRSRDRLVLLIQGDNASALHQYSKPESSETARRNTNLFQGAIREAGDQVPYADHLIHRTDKGHMVRSRAELVIANELFHMAILYDYERPFDGTNVPGKVWPDFSFINAAGDLILLEYLGMLDRDDYRQGWEWKKDWYAKNGFVLGNNLFTIQEDEKGGIDSVKITKVASHIKSLL